MSPAPGVARLFVGLPVPSAVARSLARLAPRAQQGVRPIAVSDMHITLHFLGGMAAAPVRDCLRAVAMPAFPLRVGGLGSFSPRGRRTVLWVGVLPAEELAELHRQTGKALRAVEFEPEQRAYRPHITVARLNARAPPQLAAEFQSQPAGDAVLEFECSRFALFASETAREGARYSVIESYPLGPGG